MRSRARRGPAVLAGLTPLLDTIFLLLFALLVTSDTRTENDTELVHIQLPEVESTGEESTGAGEHLVVVLDAESHVRLGRDGETLASREELDRALSQALGDALPEEIPIEIHGDAAARHGVAIELLQYLRMRGFVHVQLVAQGTSAPGGLFGAGR